MNNFKRHSIFLIFPLFILIVFTVTTNTYADIPQCEPGTISTQENPCTNSFEGPPDTPTYIPQCEPGTISTQEYPCTHSFEAPPSTPTDGGGSMTVTRPTDFQSFVGLIINIISLLILVIFSLTLVVFIWGIVKNWIIRGADPEGVQEGKKVVMVGITALVIMVSIWGILYLLQRSLFG